MTEHRLVRFAQAQKEVFGDELPEDSGDERYQDPRLQKAWEQDHAEILKKEGLSNPGQIKGSGDYSILKKNNLNGKYRMASRSSQKNTAMVRAYKVKPKKKVPRKYSSYIRGRGAYSMSNLGPVGKFGRTVGGLVGGYYGGPLGSKLGKKLGSYLHYIGKIFGSGDYVTSSNNVKYNVLVNDGQIPQFGSDKNTVRIKHREFLGDIISSSTANTFQVASYSINPGLQPSFPWLSQVCGSTFQQYRINGMVFEYRSMSADALNSTNTALGSVVMATDYDSADTAFTTKAQMENTEFGVSCKPSSCMIHAIECARNQTSVSELYIRATSNPPNTDVRLYDMGKFYIATTGFQGTSVNCGELWVSYDITLLKAIEQVPGFLIPSAHYILDNSQVATAPVALSASAIAAGLNYDNIGITISASGTQVNFPPTIPLNSIWQVMVTHSTNPGGAAAATRLSVPLVTWFSEYGVLASAVGTATNTGIVAIPNPSPPGAVIQQVVYIIYLRYNGGGSLDVPPSIVFAASTTPLTTYQDCDLFITMLNGSLP